MRRQIESKNRFLANNALINSVWYCRLFNSNKFNPNGTYQLVTLVTMYQYVMQQFPKQITPQLSLK